MKILVASKKASVDKPVDSVEKFAVCGASSPKTGLFTPFFLGLNLPICSRKYHKFYVTETRFRAHNFSVFCEKVGIRMGGDEACRSFSIFLQKTLWKLTNRKRYSPAAACNSFAYGVWKATENSVKTAGRQCFFFSSERTSAPPQKAHWNPCVRVRILGNPVPRGLLRPCRA